jgi:hypothetical protein
MSSSTDGHMHFFVQGKFGERRGSGGGCLLRAQKSGAPPPKHTRTDSKIARLLIVCSNKTIRHRPIKTDKHRLGSMSESIGYNLQVTCIFYAPQTAQDRG